MCCSNTYTECGMNDGVPARADPAPWGFTTEWIPLSNSLDATSLASISLVNVSTNTSFIEFSNRKYVLGLG